MKLRKLKRKLNTLLSKPDKVFVKYFRIYILREILPYYNEDYDKHWGFTDFKGKSILDLGADYGSTAYYFLKNKASSVVAVEGDIPLYNGLMRHYYRHRDVTCVFKMIESATDFRELLETFSADIVKVDIEGAEILLDDLPRHLLSKFKEWLIETHSDEITDKLYRCFVDAGFHVSKIKYDAGNALNEIIYASEIKVND